MARVLEQKELKVASLSQEVNGLRSQVRSKDRIIFGFKRELSSMVHIGLPKELEQAVKVYIGDPGSFSGAASRTLRPTTMATTQTRKLNAMYDNEHFRISARTPFKNPQCMQNAG